MVKRLLKGVARLRPPVPRYTAIWDVGVVLKFLRELGPVEILSLADLTLKLVMLVALVTAQRTQCLHLMDLGHVKRDDHGFQFAIVDAIKTTRGGTKQPVLMLRRYPTDPRLCVVVTLDEYLARTEPLRGAHTRLFLSTQKPHLPVHKDTIARWIRTSLDRAGIDTSQFKAHSTRAAASSAAALSGTVPIQDILTAAGWSNSRTFATFYNKPVMHNNTFAQSVLESAQ